MPIQLNYTDPVTGSAHPSSYWILKFADLDVVLKAGSYTILGFHTQTDMQNGKSPILSQTFPITFSPQPTDTNAANIANIYADAMTKPFFSGGTIVA